MDRDENDRPVHRTVHVPTGSVTDEAVTDQEWDEIEARTAQAEQAEQTRLAQDAVLQQAVDAHPDPVVQALARRAGL